jgi:signal transduction histidine kinase
LSANQKGLTISSTLESDVPAGLIGDPNRLQQLLVNLLTNGLKFTKTGGLKIHVAVKATENAKQKGAFASRKDFEHTTSTACKPSIGYQTVDLEIVVQDSGIGMTESELHRLFDPFVQSNASIAR